jgi:prolyl 4-hydroxylase
LGNYEKAIVAIDDILMLKSNVFDVSELQEVREGFRLSLELGQVETLVEHEETSLEKQTRQVCSGKVRKSAAEVSKLHCRYESRTDFSKLAPLKLEEANLDPLIVVYHNVISDSEIRILKELAKPDLEQSVVIQLNGDLTPSKDRISKVAWLDDEDHEVIERISKRVEDMTGLSAETAEQLQIQQYGIGGFYKTHFDFEENMKASEDGDRIATVMFYVRMEALDEAILSLHLSLC